MCILEQIVMCNSIPSPCINMLVSQLFKAEHTCASISASHVVKVECMQHT